jgi:hypothetical protein
MRFEPFDRERHTREVLDLFKTSLSNTAGPDWFRWKHLDNPCGPSLGFVAIDETDRIAGARFFMKWDLVLAQNTLHAFRPVDTVTHPSARGKGIFTKLTLHGIRKLGAAEQPLIFNTPNSSSLPGYLKMGWKLYPHKIQHEYFLAYTPGSLNRVQILDRISEQHIPAHRYHPDVIETRKSPAFVSWRYNYGGYRFSKFKEDQPALLVFKVIRRKAISVMMIKDFIGEPALKKILIQSTAKSLGILFGHAAVSAFLKEDRFAIRISRGGSNVALNASDFFFGQKFYFSGGDLEGVI